MALVLVYNNDDREKKTIVFWLLMDLHVGQSSLNIVKKQLGILFCYDF